MATCASISRAVIGTLIRVMQLTCNHQTLTVLQPDFSPIQFDGLIECSNSWNQETLELTSKYPALRLAFTPLHLKHTIALAQ